MYYKLKKFQVLLIALFWLSLAFAVVIVGAPLGIVLMLSGSLLSLIHIDFVYELSGCIVRSMLRFVHFVTRKIRRLTHEVEQFRA